MIYIYIIHIYILYIYYVYTLLYLETHTQYIYMRHGPLAVSSLRVAWFMPEIPWNDITRIRCLAVSRSDCTPFTFNNHNISCIISLFGSFWDPMNRFTARPSFATRVFTHRLSSVTQMTRSMCYDVFQQMQHIGHIVRYFMILHR
jgi:hypothetical protein